MDETPNLELPYILPSQAQKHVTHNEALDRLDAAVQIAVIDRDLSSPPASPVEGDRYIVAAGATGDWTGKDGQLAAFQAGSWAFFVPREGWIAWIADESLFVYRTGAGWATLSSALTVLQNLSLLGVGTDADATNPFSVRLNKTLWTAKYAAEGGDGDLRSAFNKETAADTASLLLQTGYSGRSELGLTGDDDFHLKVSPDGSTWKEAMVARGATGTVGFPSGLMHAASNAALRGLVFTPGGDGVISIWRVDASHAQNPRTATVSSISGDTITLTSAVADTFGRWTGFMAGVSYARIWNTSKAPAQSAWIKASPTTSTLQVRTAADIAAWASGETIQIGDPTSITPNRVIALDISPMMTALFGSVFPQAGIVVRASISGSSGDALSLTPSGVGGSLVTCAKFGAGDGITIIPCTLPSPISNSNLVFVNEAVATTATIELVSSIALFV